MIYVLCYESYRGGPILCINILIFENSYRMIKRELTINNNIVVSEFYLFDNIYLILGH